MEPWVVVSVFFVLGLVCAAIGNAVVDRVPVQQPVLPALTACPGCAGRVGIVRSVPLLSWLALRRHCPTPMSLRYPALELAGGVLFAAVVWRIGLEPALPGLLLFAWLLLVVTVIDLRTRRIPNRLTYPLTPTLLVLLTGAALIEGEPTVALRVVLAGLAAFAFLLVLALISPASMGMGDVKLAAFIGAGLGYLGWGHLLLGIFGSFLLGGLVATVLVITRLRRRRDQIPFGPYLAAGALVALLFGRPLLEGYLRLAGIG